MDILKILCKYGWHNWKYTGRTSKYYEYECRWCKLIRKIKV
jgi:hypothetical protein